MAMRQLSRIGIGVVAVSCALAVLSWMTDSIPSPDGTRAVYTGECARGTWDGSHCYGRLVAGPRYWFQVTDTRGEVLFWSTEGPAVGKYSTCSVEDRENWSCIPNSGSVRTIAHQMIRGRPVPDPTVPTLPFHEIEKWRWLLLQIGFPAGHEAL